jgi:hypothetical protein
MSAATAIDADPVDAVATSPPIPKNPPVMRSIAPPRRQTMSAPSTAQAARLSSPVTALFLERRRPSEPLARRRTLRRG